MSSAAPCPAVLVLAFNRPDTTAAVIDSLRATRPAHLYFAVDGARPGRPGEQDLVQKVQGAVERIDWPCRTRTLFRGSNLGCKRAVSEAISWFFDEVESGIILEDDCVAHPSYFRFAAELLHRYRDDERIAMVSGNNFQFGRNGTTFSYYYSRYTHIWGWATWRRAWKRFDFGMSGWPERKRDGWLQHLLGDDRHARYWSDIFDETHGDLNTSWAYRWIYSVWLHEGLTILPAVNLVTNIGFGAQATNNLRRGSRYASIPALPMEFPLRHPPAMDRNVAADLYTQKTMFSRPLWRSLARSLYRRIRRP